MHSTQFTEQSTQFTVDSTQYTVHSAQYTIHSTKFTAHSKQFTVHSTQYTVQNTQYTIVMHMETFVSCVGDLATLRRVGAGPDLRLFSSWTVFSFFVFSAILWRMESFSLAVPLRFGCVEFLSLGARSKTHEGTLAVWTIFLLFLFNM